MMTPGGQTLTTLSVSSDYQTVAIVNASSRLRGDPRTIVNQDIQEIDPSFIRIAIYGMDNPSAFGPSTQITAESIFECNLTLVAWKYSNVSSAGNNLTIGMQEKIDLSPGTQLNSSPFNKSTSFTQTGLPNITINNPDLASIANFFSSPSFSGQEFEGESQPAHSQGVTPVFYYQNVRNFSEVSRILDNMADSMTDQVRQEKASQLVYGNSSQVVDYIRVRWTWLVLPLVIEITGAAVLVATIVKNHEMNTTLWKSSATALLYHRIETKGMNQIELIEMNKIDTVEPNYQVDVETTISSDLKSLAQLEQLTKTLHARLE